MRWARHRSMRRLEALEGVAKRAFGWLRAPLRAVLPLVLAFAVAMSVSAHLGPSNAAISATHMMVSDSASHPDGNLSGGGLKTCGSPLECCGGCVAPFRSSEAIASPREKSSFARPAIGRGSAKAFASNPTPPPRAG